MFCTFKRPLNVCWPLNLSIDVLIQKWCLFFKRYDKNTFSGNGVNKVAVFLSTGWNWCGSISKTIHSQWPKNKCSKFHACIPKCQIFSHIAWTDILIYVSLWKHSQADCIRNDIWSNIWQYSYQRPSGWAASIAGNCPHMVDEQMDRHFAA